MCRFKPEWDISGAMKTNGRVTGVYIVLRHFESEDEVSTARRTLDGANSHFMPPTTRLEVQKRFVTYTVFYILKFDCRVIERDPSTISRGGRGRGGRGGTGRSGTSGVVARGGAARGGRGRGTRAG